MKPIVRDPIYRNHHIARAVWLYDRFPLSLRRVEDLMAEHGVIVSHQTIRIWIEKLGQI
jgi:putative transposase